MCCFREKIFDVNSCFLCSVARYGVLESGFFTPRVTGYGPADEGLRRIDKRPPWNLRACNTALLAGSSNPNK